MILLLNTSVESLHYYEFVKPIEDIIKNQNLKFKTLHYTQLKNKDLSGYEKIIICGTSLKDNKYLDDLEFFVWLKELKKPIL